MEWNGRPLQSRSYEEVRDIIASSRQVRPQLLQLPADLAALQERAIELVVARDCEGRRAGDGLGEADLSRAPFHPLEPRNMGCRLQVGEGGGRLPWEEGEEI